jgi:hypothetical protein
MAPPTRPAMTMREFADGITDLGESMASANILIHGEPGCGKTTTFASHPDSILLSCDPGFMVAKRLGYKCKIRRIPDYETLMAGISWLENGGWKQFRYGVLDGGSILQTRLLQQFNKEAWEANPEKRVSPHQPDKPDYHRQQSVLKLAVARLVDLPLNMIFTFHSARGEDQDGENWVRPQIDGVGYKAGNFINGLMSTIGYMGVTNDSDGGLVRRILWQQYHDPVKDITYLAKDQLNLFPGQMFTDNMTFDQFDRALHGPVGSDEVSVPATENGNKPTATRGRRGRG